jgi:hypothetical protein
MKLVGSLQWNFVFGGVALFLTFVSSIGNNVFSTSIFRSLLAFILFFVLTYVFRIFLSYLNEMEAPGPAVPVEQTESEVKKGNQIDWVTPGEVDLKLGDLILDKPNPDDFKTLSPSELAKVLRTMADE